MRNKIAALALVLVAGCSTKGYVKAEAVSDTFKAIRARHDAYVLADPSYDDVKSPRYGQRDSDLRETKLIDELLDEAMLPALPASKDANTTRTESK